MGWQLRIFTQAGQAYFHILWWIIFYGSMLIFRVVVYCEISEKNKILRQELTKLKVKSVDYPAYSHFFTKVCFDNLSIHVFSERFRMNLAFTFAIATFLLITMLPILQKTDIFNFNKFDDELLNNE